jgi:Alw26I/Eco31I/Esp3I family type II restriction m6 adenine DNA methyltransferase
MSSKALAETERASLNLILEDLRYLFDKEEIQQDEIDNVLQTLKSEEVKSYIQNLRYGSKPETALRESFIAGKSILLKYLFGEGIPEVRSDGFIDYLLKDEMGRGIALELKPLFEADVKLDKAGKPILERLKQKKIIPENYGEQILKYIREGEAQFVILTNLKEWFFYSKELHPKEVKHFCAIGFFDFIKEYEVIGNLRDYLERKEFESVRYELDKWFLQSLKTWVSKLSEIEFIVDDKRKLELIIGLVNKFIFVQTLDDYGVIEFNWIRKRWNYQEQMWQRKGKLMVLEKFLDEVDNWFYQYYDTELFREKVLQNVKKDAENIGTLYRNLQLILGLTYLQLPFGALKGIMQYNFRYIDEDVLGKAYETFLGEVRKEEGVYYTPKYITQYIAENTVGKAFDELLAKIKRELENGNFEGLKDLVSRFTSIRVLDPACGSGSFLIKAIRIVVSKYRELNRIIENCIKKYSNYKGSLDLPQEDRSKLELLSEIREIIGPENTRELIARILIRHIHGVDLDRRALEVAKVNLWLEAIKLAPREFRYDKLPRDTNYILPNLEMNLCNGNSLIGLLNEETISFLMDENRSELQNMLELRQSYLANPTNPEVVAKIETIKENLRKNLDKKFFGYVSSRGLPLKGLADSKPFHWPLEFWYVFYTPACEPIPSNERGFDVVMGNPPYEILLGKEAKTNKEQLRNLVNYFTKMYITTEGEPNLYKLFVERSLELVSAGGMFSMIFPTTILSDKSTTKLRNFVLSNSKEAEIVYFPEKLKVFEDVIQAVNVFVIRKGPIEELENIEFRYIKNDYEMKHIPKRRVQIPKKVVNELGLIPILQTEDELDIFLRLSLAFPRLISLMNSQQIMIYEGEIHLTRFKDCLRTNKLEGCEALVRGDNIYRYFAEIAPGNKPDWIDVAYAGKIQNLSEGKFAFRSQRRLVYKQVMNIDLPLRLIGAIIGEKIFVGNTCGFVVPNEGYSLEVMAALFNSTVWNWYFKRISSNNHILIKDLERMPAPEITHDQRRNLEDDVSQLVDLKNKRHEFVSRWKWASTHLKNKELTLQEILLKDLELSRIGKFKETWTTKIGFFPGEVTAELQEAIDFVLSLESFEIEKNGLDIIVKGKTKQKKDVVKAWKLNDNDFIKLASRLKEYKAFEVVGYDEGLRIEIYGIDSGSSELICWMEFANRELMSHVYACLTQTATSKLRIKKVNELISKTLVPFIESSKAPSNVLTGNIIKRAQEGFASQEQDLVRLDNMIRKLEAKVDCQVFLLHSIDAQGAEFIMKSLGLLPSFTTGVLNEFRRIVVPQ